MNREIKFRGKTLENNSWVYGYFDMLEIKKVNYYYIGDKYGIKFQVDPNTICQSIGLRDTNGRGIYEGDILGFPCNVYRDSVKRVEIMEEIVKHQCSYKDATYEQGHIGKDFVSGFKVGGYYGNEFKVIGNIHDN